MSGQKIQKNQGIQVISRATDILRVLGRETVGLSLGQIAHRVALPRSTVQRIVATLALEGLISIEKGNAGIRLGPEIQSLAQASFATIRDRLRPMMKEISQATGETVDLAVLEGQHMRFIDQIVGTQRLRTVSSIGEVFPLTTTANGKAALACLEPAEAEKLIRAEFDMQKGASKSLHDLMAELKTIRSGVLARDENEHTNGVSALGFAVQDAGSEIYAISVPVPTSRFERTSDDLAGILRAIRANIVI